MSGEGAAPRLTPREREVLAAIGRRWSNVEIAREFFVSVRTVESHVAALRRKLGAASRADLIRLASRHLARPVPVPANSFVGREDELRDVRRLLDRTPWVTITGPPGSGKTRLALELAQRAARAGDREPVVVELDRSAPGAAVTPLASVLGIAAPGAAAGTGDPTDDLAAACALALGTGHFLLVLDSCERAASEVERLARTLIRSGAVTVVATSQVPIGAGDETVYPLDPLPITADAAIRLFVDRAAAAAPARPVSTADLASVERICRRLDGLPLAIELAAARTRHLTLPELADRLDESLAVLDRAGPAHRHRRLESAFDWTWDLLDDEERELLQLLAAMPGNFDMTLVESVAPDLPGGAPRVALRLLDRSLIAPAGAPSEPARFRLLDSLRRFVGGRTPPEVAAGARRRHAELHAQASEAIASRIGTDDDLSLIARAQRLIPEAAAALRWVAPLDADLGLRLARSLAILVEHAGPDLEALTAITRAATTPPVRDRATAEDLLPIGLAVAYHDLRRAEEIAHHALAIADDAPSQLAAHHLAGWIASFQRTGQDAERHLSPAEHLAERLGRTSQLASIRQARGLAWRTPDQDDPDRALAYLESAADTFAEAGDAMHVNNCLYMMAAVAADTGRRLDEARTWIERFHRHAVGHGNRHEIAHAELTLARLAPESEIDLKRLTTVLRQVGDLRCLTRSYILLAERKPGDATHWLGLALETARAIDRPSQVDILRRLIAAHGRNGARDQALQAFGELSVLVGRDQAEAACRAELADELMSWQPAEADGRARAVSRG